MSEHCRKPQPFVTPVLCGLAGILFVLTAAGCSSPISTPLPSSTQSLKPALTPLEEKKAVDDLNKQTEARRAAAIKALESRQ